MNSDRFSTGLKGLEVGSDVFQDHVPEDKERQPPPDYSDQIPVGVDKKKGEIAYMSVESSDRVGIFDKTGGGKTAYLKRIVYGFWKGGGKILYPNDIKNDFRDIDKHGGISEKFRRISEGLAPGETPEELPKKMFIPKFLANEYRRAERRVPHDIDEFGYSFQQLAPTEIRDLVNATSGTQKDILTEAINSLEDLTYRNIVEFVNGHSAQAAAKQSLLTSIRSLIEEEVVQPSLSEKQERELPVEHLEDNVVVISMANRDSYKREGHEYIELQISIALRRLKHRLRFGDLEGPVVIIFDEAHTVASNDNLISTPEIVEMVDLGRAFDIPMVFSSQRPAQISEEIMDGMSHLFVGPNVPKKQRRAALEAADLFEWGDWGKGKWMEIFRDMGKYDFMHIDVEQSRWRVISPFAPPCFHPVDD